MCDVFFRRGVSDQDAIDVRVNKIEIKTDSCIKSWNVCATILNPKGTRRNSNKPKGVMTVVP